MKLAQEIETFLLLHAKNTRRLYSRTYRDFCADLQSATLDDVVEFLSKKRSGGSSDATLRAHQNALSSLFGYLVARRFRSDNPCNFLRYVFPTRQHVQVRPTAAIPWSAVRELLKNCDLQTESGVRDHAILCLLFGGALRRSELVALNCGDVLVSGDSRSLLLRRTKSGQRQEQPIPAWAAVSLGRLLIQRHHQGAASSDPLIISGTGNRLTDRSLARRFGAWCAAIGLKAAPHAARAAAATRLLDLGYSDRDAARLLRHGDTQQVATYDKRRRSRENHPGINLSL